MSGSLEVRFLSILNGCTQEFGRAEAARSLNEVNANSGPFGRFEPR